MMRSPGRMKYLAGSESGAGAWISDTTPERIAERFREVGGPRWFDTRSETKTAATATELFKHVFGADATGVWAAPGRVNLIGEHVDYAGGVCLPFALAQNTFAAVSLRSDGRCRVVSDLDPADIVDMPLSAVRAGRPDNWAGYVVGTIWALQQSGVIPAHGIGFDIAITSDVPVGAGLSSSAALECSVGLAAFELANGRSPSVREREAIIAAAMRAENEIVGAATGGLDQRIAMKAQEGRALAIDFGVPASASAGSEPNSTTSTDRLVHAAFEDSGLVILVINTNVSHSLADGQYASRRGIIDAVTTGLGVTHLSGIRRPLTAAAEWANSNVPADSERNEWVDLVTRRVRHVVTEIERTIRAISELESGDFVAFGQSMIQSHISLRDDYEVSCPELDLVVDAAVEMGALGARMTGGGFGGSAIALVEEDKVCEVATAVARRCAALGNPEPEFLIANPAAGARRLAATSSE